MKTVLWVSRHEMTADQFSDLERVMGDKVHLLVFDDTVQDVSVLAPLLQQADAAAVVMPLPLLAQMRRLTGDKPLLCAVSGRKPTGRMRQLDDGRQEKEFAFVHMGWEQIVRLELETKML